MEDKQESQPKKRGRPKKDPNAPKARYNLSRAERARRALQARVRKAEKAKENAKAAGAALCSGTCCWNG